MDFSDRHAKINKRLMESWGYSLDEKKTEKGFGEGTPPEGEWYDKKVVVMEDHDQDHPGMCCADAHSGQDHGAWATAQQQGRTEAPIIASLEEGEDPDWLKKIKGDDDDSAGDDDEPSAEASSAGGEELVDEPEDEPEDKPGAKDESKKRTEHRKVARSPGHAQNPLHEHEELVKRVVERVVARLQKS